MTEEGTGMAAMRAITVSREYGSAVDVIYLALDRKARRLASPPEELGPIAGLAQYPGQPEDFRSPR